MKNTELWNNCLERLESTLSENDFNTWVRPLQSELSGTILNIFAPNRFVCDWLNDNLGQQLLDTVQHFMGMEYKVKVIIGSSETEVKESIIDNTVASDGLSVEEIKEHNVNTLTLRLLLIHISKVNQIKLLELRLSKLVKIQVKPITLCLFMEELAWARLI